MERLSKFWLEGQAGGGYSPVDWIMVQHGVVRLVTDRNKVEENVFEGLQHWFCIWYY
ncbi:MAG: hypothetical protein WCK35_23410 [Chloroflexota bacterium]